MGSHSWGGEQFEAGLRLGARRGVGVVDLSLSTYDLEFINTSARYRQFEALVGVSWQPSVLGLGMRSGVANLSNAVGERWMVLAFGPHYLLAIPIGGQFELRSEAGLNVYYHRDFGVIELSRSFIRIGFERRLR